MPTVGTNGTRNLICPCVVLYIACQLGSVIGADKVELEKKAPKTEATKRNPIPYDITKRTILNPRKTNELKF